jgi:hypothetical protein
MQIAITPTPYTPSCADCMHGATESWSATREDMGGEETNCTHPAGAILMEDAGDDIGATCPYFRERPAGICGGCSTAIETPKRLHGLWVAESMSGESYPVCSDACKAAAEAKETKTAASYAAFQRQMGW